MGTEARLVLYAPSQSAAETAARAGFARIGQLDSALSDYRRESELVSVLMQGANVPVPVSDDLMTVLGASLALSAETEGAFDVTVGRLTVRQRFWRTAGGRTTTVECASSGADWRRIMLDTVARTVVLKSPGMRLDFGGIGKGYAADEALAALRAHGVERALVSIGGDIVAGAAPPGMPGWRVNVEAADSAHRSMVFENGALSTSGDTEQFLDGDSVRNSHVIDPRTGAPLTSRLMATVHAPTGMQADGWSTAVTVMDSTARAKFIAAHPEGQFYVRVNGDGPPPARRPWCRVER